MRTFTLAGAVAALLLSSPALVAADSDPSAPYRNYPGFVCHHWSGSKCMNFSYDSEPTYGPRYVAPIRKYDSYYGTYPYYGNVLSYEDVTVRVSASRDDVRTGDTLTYTIYVRNNDRVSRTVDVRGYVDSETSFLSASGNGRERVRDEVEWRGISIRANDSVTLTLRVRVDGRYGDTIRFRARAGSDEDNHTATIRDDYYRGRYSDDCYDDYYYDNRSYDSDYYYDSYGNRVRRSSSSSYYRDCYDNDPYDDISLSLRATPNPAQIGGLITYTITVRNDENVRRDVDVTAFLDDRTSFYSASDLGASRSNSSLRSGDQVRFGRISLNPRSSRTFTVSARIDTDARNNRNLVFRVRAGNREQEVTTQVEDRYYYNNDRYYYDYYRY